MGGLKRLLKDECVYLNGFEIGPKKQNHIQTDYFSAREAAQALGKLACDQSVTCARLGKPKKQMPTLAR